MENCGICKKSLAAIMASDKAIKPVKELLRSVQKKLEPFEEGKRFQNLRGVVKWCEDYAMVQQAFTLCQEGLVTLACERIENPLTGDEERTAQRQLRDVVSAVLAVDKEVMTDESMWKRDLLLDKNLSRKLFAMDGIVRIRKITTTLLENATRSTMRVLVIKCRVAMRLLKT